MVINTPLVKIEKLEAVQTICVAKRCIVSTHHFSQMRNISTLRKNNQFQTLIYSMIHTSINAWENSLVFQVRNLKTKTLPGISHHLSSLECGWGDSAHPSSHQSDGKSSWRGTGWWGPGLYWYRQAALSWTFQRQKKFISYCISKCCW